MGKMSLRGTCIVMMVVVIVNGCSSPCYATLKDGKVRAKELMSALFELGGEKDMTRWEKEGRAEMKYVEAPPSHKKLLENIARIHITNRRRSRENICHDIDNSQTRIQTVYNLLGVVMAQRSVRWKDKNEDNVEEQGWHFSSSKQFGDGRGADEEEEKLYFYKWEENRMHHVFLIALRDLTVKRDELTDSDPCEPVVRVLKLLYEAFHGRSSGPQQSDKPFEPACVHAKNEDCIIVTANVSPTEAKNPKLLNDKIFNHVYTKKQDSWVINISDTTDLEEGMVLAHAIDPDTYDGMGGV